MSKNYRKCNYAFMFPHNNWARQALSKAHRCKVRLRSEADNREWGVKLTIMNAPVPYLGYTYSPHFKLN